MRHERPEIIAQGNNYEFMGKVISMQSMLTLDGVIIEAII